MLITISAIIVTIIKDRLKKDQISYKGYNTNKDTFLLRIT